MGLPIDDVDLLDELSPELLARYSRPGPRYTSYPTAPEWREGWSEQDLLPALDAANRQGAAAPLSFYVHLPFCGSMCRFCGCSVVISHKADRADPYLERLEAEAQRWASHLPDRREVDQLHWGGGTPTFLSPARLEQLWQLIFTPFTLSDTAEVSIEVDPRVTTAEQLELLRGLGFNRISMGVQDFTPEVQVAINRVQPEAITRKVFDKARELGFRGINVDLIYGLPYQTPESFADTIRRVVAMRPDRIAVFGYAHVPWLKPHQKHIPEAALPPPDQRFALYRTAWRGLVGAGYRAIGMDHFALPDDELAAALDRKALHRNFQGYTTRPGLDMVSLGATAIADVQGRYTQNQKSLILYYRDVDQGRLAAHRGIALSPEDERRRLLINTLLCNFELEKAAHAPAGTHFDAHYAAELERLAPMAAEGLVELTAERISVPPRGRMFIRNVCMAFDQFLHRPRAAQQETPRFSQTI